VIVLELVVGLAILMLLVGMSALTLQRFAKTQAHYAAREAAAWAAEAQLARIQAGAAPDSAPPAGLLAREITLATRTTPGGGCWSEFTLVSVTATFTPRHGKPVTETARGYARMEISP
jgi:Tfp pilus assembly protein PilV